MPFLVTSSHVFYITGLIIILTEALYSSAVPSCFSLSVAGILAVPFYLLHLPNSLPDFLQ